jgi:rhodanese-related sulfurtransferase
MSIRQISPLSLAAFLADHPDALLVDVREPWEHELVALLSSRLIPLGQLAARAGDELPDIEIPIVLYCHHGIRSLQGCGILASLGYEDLINLSGGIDRYASEVDRSMPVY